MGRKLYKMLGMVLVMALGWGQVSWAESFQTKAYAVVIGVNQSVDSEVPALSFADDDAVKMFQLMRVVATEVHLFSVLDPETQRLWPELVELAIPPTKEILGQTIQHISEKMAADTAAGVHTVFYFIYSGHGFVDTEKQGYVSLLNERFTREDLFELVIRKSTADTTHILIDACNSYYLVKKRGEYHNDRSSANFEEQLNEFLTREELEKFPRVGIVVSTAGSGDSHEWTRFQGGIFSHEVRSALLGGADINTDGRVTYDELAAFVAAANAKVEDPRAKLSIHIEPPAYNLATPLLDRSWGFRQGGSLFMEVSEAGKFYLENQKGIRYADFNKSPEQPLEIALLPAEFYVLFSDAFEAKVEPKPQRILYSQLEKVARVVARRGPLEEDLQKHLFLVPFGRSFYDGFLASQGPNARLVASEVQPPVKSSDLGSAGTSELVSQTHFEYRGSSPSLVLAWVTTGVALAAGVSSGVLFALAKQDADAYRNSIVESEAGDIHDRAQGEFIASMALVGVAALSAGAALYFFLTAGDDMPPQDLVLPQDDPRELSLLPLIGQDSAGAAFLFRF